MRKSLMIMLVVFSSFAMNAQTDELDKLIDLVKSLQVGGEQAYNKAVTSLATDPNWTPMDELGFDRDVECRVSDRVPGFRLNSVLTNAENQERYQTTTGNHLNGADLRYNYSLFEKTLKAGKTASFSLPQRWGGQTLVIIPYNSQGGITAQAVSGNNDFAVTSLGGGVLKLTGAVEKGQMLELTVTNDSHTNVSYVIINYNSRK